MRREKVSFSRVLRVWFYGVFGGLFLSGAIWLALHAWGASQGEFEPQPNPAEPWLLRLHGALAMAALVVLGVLLPIHIARGWKAHRNRSAGAFIVGLCAMLITTGCALYYAGGEEMRWAAALTHDALGLFLPIAFAWHIVSGRRTRPAHPPRSAARFPD